MSEKFTVHYEIHGEGEVEVDVDEVRDLTTEADLRGWIMEGVEIDIEEGNGYSIKLRGLEEVVRRVMKEIKKVTR